MAHGRWPVALLLAAGCAVGCAAAATGVVGVASSRPPGAEGSLREAFPPHARTARVAAAVPSAAGFGPVEVHGARLADATRAVAGSAPVRVLVRSVGMSAHVVAVGPGATAGIRVPSDVRVAGWYRFGPAPGQPGSAVLVGHVDDRAQGLGAFSRLLAARPGEAAVVRLADGSSVPFRIVARRVYHKDALPSFLFGRSGPARLVLITCGGPFDAATGHYADNVVIIAVAQPAGPGPRSPMPAA